MSYPVGKCLTLSSVPQTGKCGYSSTSLTLPSLLQLLINTPSC